MALALLLGIVFGFFGAMPLAGPVALIIFSRGMEGRFRAGLFTALGSSSAEFIYALLAFLGFATFLAEVPWVLPVSKGAAAIVMLFLGITFMRRKVGSTEQAAPEKDRKRHALALGFLLTALNPTLIATWAAATTTLYSMEIVSFQPDNAWVFALGVFGGDMLWYWLMLVLTHRYRLRFGPVVLHRVLQVMGLGLIGLAVWFVVTLVQMWMAA